MNFEKFWNDYSNIDLNDSYHKIFEANPQYIKLISRVLIKLIKMYPYFDHFSHNYNSPKGFKCFRGPAFVIGNKNKEGKKDKYIVYLKLIKSQRPEVVLIWNISKKKSKSKEDYIKRSLVIKEDTNFEDIIKVVNDRLDWFKSIKMKNIDNFENHVGIIPSGKKISELTSLSNGEITQGTSIEIENPDLYIEGATKQIFVNSYERNSQAREKCIEHYGVKCSVCSFSFEEIYGSIGKEYIHIHHLTPLSEIGQEYHLDPINDLRPVCPNCHVMLHRRQPTLSIEQLKFLIKKQ